MSIRSHEGCDAGGGGDQPEKRGGMLHRQDQTDRPGLKKKKSVVARKKTKTKKTSHTMSDEPAADKLRPQERRGLVLLKQPRQVAALISATRFCPPPFFAKTKEDRRGTDTLSATAPPHQTCAGVPPGCVLGPVRFTIKTKNTVYTL